MALGFIQLARMGPKANLVNGAAQETLRRPEHETDQPVAGQAWATAAHLH
jgi:hypothetical protein